MSESATLVLRASPRRGPELAWVADLLLERWLGLNWRFEPHASPLVELQASGGSVVWPDMFFAGADARWLTPQSLPGPPLANWPLPDPALCQRIGHDSLPIVCGDGRFESGAARVRLPIDITGSAFLLLSRYEEAVAGAPQDRHGRFPGRASLMQRAGLALRPLVDELVELLWWALAPLAPGLQRARPMPGVWISCDVDQPFAPSGAAAALRMAASTLVNERSPRLACQLLLNAAASRMGIRRFDPCDTFDWMLDANERAGHRMTFFFLSLQRPQRIDCDYELGQPRIASLIDRIVRRGHEIGLHGSYRSAGDATRLAAELAGLKAAAACAGSAQQQFGARQHYLRWRTPDAARALDALGAQGLAWDSTLGFADVAGFRCGTSRRYPLFDLLQRRALGLIERPLVAMEATVVSHAYLGLGHSRQALELLLGLKRSCARFGGEFSLLWHNSNLGHPAAREMYRALIAPP